MAIMAQAAQTAAQQEMAALIIDVLNIDDVAAREIDPDAILFDESGLGLDSIDALEIAVAIAEHYNVHISAEDEATREIFATLANLTAHVMQESGAPQPAT
jgi:acyl carrier protein